MIFSNRKKDCYNCQFIPYCNERGQAKKEIAKKAEAARQQVLNNELMPKKDKAIFATVRTGVINLTNKSRNKLLNHAHHDYDVRAATYIWNHPEDLEFFRESPLGEGKDMTTEKAQRNIIKKEKAGYIGFNVYRFSYDGKVFNTKLAVHKKGYELFYSIYEE